jgi:hypothetical protein
LGAALGPVWPAPGELEDVRALAAQGSLNEAAWGLAYPDLWRMLAPIPPRLRFEKDRGWAMEQAWKRRLLEPAPRMSDWMRGVREGWRPAVAMNATGVESGQRATFGTFRAPDAWGLHTLASRYPGKDIEVSTAARLSATFPYVTPIARAWPESAETSAVHFADGGYYDNTGMGIAMLWLDRALSQDPARYAGRQVAFIRIRSGPAVSATAVKDRAWLYESIGPFQTLLAVRTAGQRERADTELQFLQRLWCARGTDIKSIEFSFERADPPLSWQLSPAQASAIDVEWRADRNQAALDDLRKTAASPVTTGCVAAR